MRWGILLIGWILIGPSLRAQTDSTVLSFEEYFQNILEYHPLAQSANLQLDLREAELLGARGLLDPIVKADWNQKNFDDKLYYQIYSGKLLIPTPLGVDVVAGYENTDGIFLNPERTTDRFGLWNFGVEVNALQGLLINERRTALRQAEVFQNLAESQRRILLNDLLYAAADAYFNWQENFYAQEVLAENIDLAAVYFVGTRESYLGGEKTAMDTLEAYIQLQDATIRYQKRELDLIKARQNVENFLWFRETPVLLRPQTTPEDYQDPLLPDARIFAEQNLAGHPLVLAAINKLSILELEQRLKREKLKPKLKIKYNPLLATDDTDISPNLNSNDFKWGFDFSFPLLLRSARADVQRGEVKLLEAGLDLQNKRNELLNKIEGSLEQLAILDEQLILQERNLDRYLRLLEGERELFRFGESSVFLLNKRQEKYIDGRIKLIETYVKRQMEALNFMFYTNRLL